MPSPANLAIVASAGSGKTHELIRQATSDPGSRVLIVTYTNENLRQLEDRLSQLPAGYPPNVDTMSLFGFLLRECVKPLQVSKTQEPNFVRSIHFHERPVYAQRAGLRNFNKYFLNSAGDVYSDFLSQAACEINQAVSGAMIQRLELLWDEIYIDEAQDMSGYDLDLLDALLASRIRVVMVCDPRQAVYSTNAQVKHKKYRGSGFIDWINERVEDGIVARENKNECRRSLQEICDFADSLYPRLEPTTSTKEPGTRHHTGVFLVHESAVGAYTARHKPQELRWDRRNRKAGPSARNMGKVKGLSFEDVLVHPTTGMIAYLESNRELAPSTLAKLYVAVTRAEYSVGIVTNKASTKTQLPFWSPERE
ncbi:UvrD-helicase domain-containing protein [Nesterenkonia sp. AY15]|uniref:UvrD-helicase domain-containing protein n=1 Tax=Nesterenkonia sp. AY15 TaxID=2901139 RepID=UPI001F4C7A5C|nr:UvrD-helicase domain-containing protein [Nesterenkonia sp. AY15]MCH8572195.1 UvrD-helicase domain-containing protein [Nesterenkonia sp. AY15]